MKQLCCAFLRTKIQKAALPSLAAAFRNLEARAYPHRRTRSSKKKTTSWKLTRQNQCLWLLFTINLASDLAARPSRAMDVDICCAGTHGPDQFVFNPLILALNVPFPVVDTEGTSSYPLRNSLINLKPCGKATTDAVAKASRQNKIAARFIGSHLQFRLLRGGCG